MFQTNGINHIAFVTRDLDATVAFYTEVLNFPLIVTSFLPDKLDPAMTEADQIALKHYFFDCGGGSAIAFFTWHPSLPAGYGGDAHHISFNVRTVAELEQAQAHIRSKGCPVSPVLDHGYLRSIYTRDPNGIVVEVSVWMAAATAARPHIEDPDPVPAARRWLGVRQEQFYSPAMVRDEELRNTREALA